MKSQDQSLEQRVESLIDINCHEIALIHLNSYLEASLTAEMEAYESEDLEYHSADIEYSRARERVRNHQIDEDHEYALLDCENLTSINSDQHLFQVIDEIAAARKDYAHTIEAYGEMNAGQHESIDVEEAAEYGLEIYQKLD